MIRNQSGKCEYWACLADIPLLCAVCGDPGMQWGSGFWGAVSIMQLSLSLSCQRACAAACISCLWSDRPYGWAGQSREEQSRGLSCLTQTHSYANWHCYRCSKCQPNLLNSLTMKAGMRREGGEGKSCHCVWQSEGGPSNKTSHLVTSNLVGKQ